MVANIEASLISEFSRRVGTNPLEAVALVGVERLTGSNKANKLAGGTDKLYGSSGVETRSNRATGRETTR